MLIIVRKALTALGTERRSSGTETREETGVDELTGLTGDGGDGQRASRERNRAEAEARTTRCERTDSSAITQTHYHRVPHYHV